MFVCKDCGCLMDHPMVYHGVWLEHFGRPCREYHTGCVECGGEVEEAHECDCCGKWITGQYIETKSGYYYCDNCYVEADVNE